MRPALERLLLIEQQLHSTPAALPPDEWHLRQLLDGELSADTQLQQQIYHGLHQAGRQQLRRELLLIHERLYAPQASGWLGWLRRIWPL